MTPEETREAVYKLKVELGTKRRLAHSVLFKHRHSLDTPEFHYQIIDAFHGHDPKVVIEGFRDSAKSTIAEEGMVIKALLKEFKFGVVVGSSYPRAKERLEAISNEFVVNENIEYLFGKQQGEQWGAGKIVLTNGVCIMALGRGMSMRGMRHLDSRPDFGLLDDLEDEEDVKNPELRDGTIRWIYKTFLPALRTEGNQVRVLGNRLDNDAVVVRLSKDADWKHLRFPIMEQAIDGTERYDLPAGKWKPMWEAKIPLVEIAKKRASYQRMGRLHDFNCEYMCEADDPEAKLFKDGQARTAATVRTWQATYAAYDPARTVGEKSAMTGVAVFSWMANRLIVWRGDAQLWLPDQICTDIFETDERFSPAEIGVEATGLEEFIMQPLRHQALQRKQLLPIRRLKPPRGKDSFISGLQPLFKAGEVEFVDVSQEARGQLLSFPTGRKDFPNALAYALMMRPGMAVYDGFGRQHVDEQPIRLQGKMVLALNATAQYTTAVLLQLAHGQLRVFADWIREGPPGECLADILQEAQIEAGAQLRFFMPPRPLGSVDTVGLGVACHSLNVPVAFGGEVLRGREELRRLLESTRHETPAFACGVAARWTLNALQCGFCYEMDKQGRLSRDPTEGPYRVLMEGLESFAGAMAGVTDADQEPRYAYTSDGRAYKTILATGQVAVTTLKRPG